MCCMFEGSMMMSFWAFASWYYFRLIIKKIYIYIYGNGEKS